MKRTSSFAAIAALLLVVCSPSTFAATKHRAVAKPGQCTYTQDDSGPCMCRPTPTGYFAFSDATYPDGSEAEVSFNQFLECDGSLEWVMAHPVIVFCPDGPTQPCIARDLWPGAVVEYPGGM